MTSRIVALKRTSVLNGCCVRVYDKTTNRLQIADFPKMLHMFCDSLAQCAEHVRRGAQKSTTDIAFCICYICVTTCSAQRAGMQHVQRNAQECNIPSPFLAAVRLKLHSRRSSALVRFLLASCSVLARWHVVHRHSAVLQRSERLRLHRAEASWLRQRLRAC